MAEVVGEDERAHAEPRGRHRGGGERGDRGELIAEVVGDVDDRVAELLDAPDVVDPGRARADGRDGDAEAERMERHRQTTL